MISTTNILFRLKRALLEYSLKNRIDYLVQKLAYDEKCQFSSFNISSIRFELYNLYIMVKLKKFSLFENPIKFLITLNANFPEILEEKLLQRVLVSLKALYIYDCLRLGDLKKTSGLMKEYFPIDSVKENPSSNERVANHKTSKSSLEFKILRLRSEWNELILNKNKRDSFFENLFHKQYDDEFLNFLLIKVNTIIDEVNNNFPSTQIEELIGNQFKKINFTLFETNQELELELEDNVRLELIIDNLKLHKIHLESIFKDEIKPKTYLTKYIKKIYKIIVDWQAKQDLSFSGNEFATQSCSQQGNVRSIIHEVLYLDSQYDNRLLTDDENIAEYSLTNYDKNEASPQNSNKKINEFKLPKPLSTIENITDDISDLCSKTDASSIHQQNFTTFVTVSNTFHSNKTNNQSNETEKFMKKHISASDLITDDEKDLNISESN